MDTMKRIEIFEEECNDVIKSFNKVLFYDFETDKGNNFRYYAAGVARGAKEQIMEYHYSVLIGVRNSGLLVFKKLEDVFYKALETIDNAMLHTNTYIEYVNYLESKQN